MILLYTVQTILSGKKKNLQHCPNVHYKTESKERCSYNEKDLLLAWIYF